MNIGQRLGALTQTVELLSSLHQELEKQAAARFAGTLDFINRLAHVAKDQESRLEDLPGGDSR